MRKTRILVVDDEITFTHLLKQNLEECGNYEVLVENQADHALPRARAFQPDLILLDIMMPQMDGGQVAAGIQGDPDLKNTPIVFLTAIATKEEVALQNGRRQDGTYIVAKPTSIQEILKTVARAMATCRPEQSRLQ